MEKPRYREAGLPVEERVKDLLGRMNLEEKIRELNMYSMRKLLKDGRFSAGLAGGFFKGAGIGALEGPSLPPEESARAVNELQKYLIENTRLGIPALIISECLHGFLSPGATVFPQAIGLASTWNSGLVRKIASVAAQEARSCGSVQGLAPDLDLAREPRWGRVEETYGEDPYLCSVMGVEYIKGLQGGKNYVEQGHLAATVKHFAAHGSPEGGVNLSPVAAGERQLRELYLVPFRKAVREAGTLSVMPAYSELDGIPCHASKFLLRRILREEFGFKGYVISDFEAVNMLHSFHHTAETAGEAGKQALEAGVDIEAPDIVCYGEEFKQKAIEGSIDEKLIDQAVARVLTVKFLTGIFENPYADVQKASAFVNCGKNRELALEAAYESIVLLKNENRLLPLDGSVGSIAVIGPNAAVAQQGDYSIPKEGAVPLLQGIRNRAPEGTKVSYARGCGLYEQSRDGFAEAIGAARNSRIAIVAVGESSTAQGGVGWGKDGGQAAICGEGFDRTDLNLPGVQQELVEAIVATGTPTIVVMYNGRPLSIPWIAENVPALIEAWYAGEEGGNALADILFGRVNPSGRLPVSFPKDVGQAPVYYNHKPSARGYYHKPGTPEKPGRDYVFMDTEPLFEFGFGLSYTEFEYSDLSVMPERIYPEEKTLVSVTVKNIGDREGKEVVQLYLNDAVSSVTTPVKALRGFKKITLGPGEKVRLSFAIGPEDLSLIDENMEEVVEPGGFEVIVGNLKKKFTVASSMNKNETGYKT